MRIEITSAAEFLVDLARLQNGRMTDAQLDKFKENVCNILMRHYADHWFPDKPFKGSGYRCIRINGNLDPLIARAGFMMGLACSFLRSLFPKELTMWVDPKEVAYRIGENGSICVLYEEPCKIKAQSQQPAARTQPSPTPANPPPPVSSTPSPPPNAHAHALSEPNTPVKAPPSPPHQSSSPPHHHHNHYNNHHHHNHQHHHYSSPSKTPMQQSPPLSPVTTTTTTTQQAAAAMQLSMFLMGGKDQQGSSSNTLVKCKESVRGGMGLGMGLDHRPLPMERLFVSS